jgi:beta-phosphoglucomutase
MIHAIFFDFNGVIINDERIHLKAYRQLLDELGIPLTDEDYFASLGMDDVAFVRAAYARANQNIDDTTLRELIDREHALHRELIRDDLPVSAGVIALVKECARSYDLGVVSMAERQEIDHVLALAGLADQFTLIVSAEPGRRHKPAPDCYQDALEFLNQKRRAERKLPRLASECLVIEDAPPGIKAGLSAGMRTIAVTTTVAEPALRAAGADIVTPNLSDWNADAIHHLFD